MRQALKRAISGRYFSPGETTLVVTLDPAIEQEIMGSIKQTETGAFLTLDPQRSRAIIDVTAREARKLEESGRNPIVMTSPIVRMYFKRMTEDVLPELIVISYNEVEPNVELKSIGIIST